MIKTKKAIEEAFGNPKKIIKLTHPFSIVQCPHISRVGKLEMSIIEMGKWSDGTCAALLGYCYKCKTAYYYEL